MENMTADLYRMIFNDKSRIEDIRITADMTRVEGFLKSRPPVFRTVAHNIERGVSFSGLCGWCFDYGEGVFQSAFFNVQLPHSYLPGTPLEPHVHVMLLPSSDALPGQKLLLEFEYTWINIDEKKSADTSIISINHEVSRQDLESGNTVISFGLIEKADASVSGMLGCRFSRICRAESWGADFWMKKNLENDSFAGTLVFREFDFHYITSLPE